MQFCDIKGHSEEKERLINSVKENRVSHAQLFKGKTAYGSLALAIAYAQYINCPNRTENDSCGECPSCKKVSSLMHPDLHFVLPIVSSKDKTSTVDYLPEWREIVEEQNAHFSFNDWEKKIEASQRANPIINTKDCNNVINTLSLHSYEGGYKIMIMWRVENLFHAAAPKLLKILEEPTDKTLFLLIAEDDTKMLKTILSRTQMQTITPYKESELIEMLVENENIDATEAKNIAVLSEGDYNKAVSILKSDNNTTKYFDIFKEWMRLCYRWDEEGLKQINNLIDTIAKMGISGQKNFLLYAMNIIRQAISLNTRKAALNLNKEEIAFAQNFGKYIIQKDLIGIYEEFNKSVYHIERQANPKILFMDMTIKMGRFLNK